jgi:hypothetical protein
MHRNLYNIEFPDGIKSIYVNGKYYTKEEFINAKKKSRLRNAKGRFVKV